MKKPQAQIYRETPEVGATESPALYTDSQELWLCYEAAPSCNHLHAVVRFGGLIEHWLSPINDEGLGEHPYMKAGLQPYSFNEVLNSTEALRWSVLKARHWVITFKDVTLDVVARDVSAYKIGIQGSDASSALLAVIKGTHA